VNGGSVGRCSRAGVREGSLSFLDGQLPLPGAENKRLKIELAKEPATREKKKKKKKKKKNKKRLVIWAVTSRTIFDAPLSSLGKN
jgi:hypothetical protein